MKKILVIGIGAGNPDHVTIQAVNALNDADVFFMLDKGDEKSDLAQLRTEICQRFIKEPSYRIVTARDPERDRRPADYAAEVAAWRAKRAALYAALIRDELKDGECGAFLVWGDPALYDGTIGILRHLLETGDVAFDFEVIPGISSVQALAARHKIPLNRTGETIHITPARKLGDAMAADNVVVMLDAGSAFTALTEGDLEIFWGAYIGTPDEVLASGTLSEVGPNLARRRAEKKAEKGWIMDTYLLRRRKD
jgi:precorrin-6A synthase